MREKGGNYLVPGPDCMVDALKLPNQAPRVSGESLQTCVVWRCPDHLQGVFSLNWGSTKPNRRVSCILFKATSNGRRTTGSLPR
ncbi:hypothetical protein TNCV_852101 [Trichonephila clavipes]|nr:hypothetical protein TNCV_852101 [Trichonephila clavipes]